MAYSAPITWVAGDRPTAAQFNQDIRDNVAFLANPPACRVTDATNQSLTNNTLTDLTFGTEEFDTDNMHSTVTNTNRITINTAGLYVVGGYVTLATDNDYTEVLARLVVDATTDIGQTRTAGTLSGVQVMSVSAVYKFSAAQFVTLNVRQTNTSAGANNAQARAFYATWIGLG